MSFFDHVLVNGFLIDHLSLIKSSCGSLLLISLSLFPFSAETKMFFLKQIMSGDVRLLTMVTATDPNGKYRFYQSHAGVRGCQSHTDKQQAAQGGGL